MDVSVSQVQGITVVTLTGELTGKTAPEAQQFILAQAKPACKMLLDMSGVPYMSSAGLRVLLVVYRTVSGMGGRALLIGLSDDLKNTMAVTGFLEFFTHRDSLEAGIAELTA
jgi:anti-sigma B factor antagonist